MQRRISLVIWKLKYKIATKFTWKENSRVSPVSPATL